MNPVNLPFQISSFFCCCCCGDKWDYEKMRHDDETTTATAANPELAEGGIRVSSTAKTLVSTRPILKKGTENWCRENIYSLYLIL